MMTKRCEYCNKFLPTGGHHIHGNTVYRGDTVNEQQRIAELEAQVDVFIEILEMFARINKVADKFCLPHLCDAGDEWDEFVERMQKQVTVNKIIA